GAGDAAEGETRNIPAHIGRRIPLAQFVSDGGTQNLVDFVRAAIRRPEFVIVANARADLHHHVRVEDVGPAYGQARFGEAIALPEKAHRRGAAGHGEAFLLRIPRLAPQEKAVLIARNVIDFEKLAAPGVLLHILNEEVV